MQMESEVPMFRTLLTLLLTLLLIAHPAPAATTEKVARKATEIPVGSVVTVKLKNRTVKGQLLTVAKDGIDIRAVDAKGVVQDEAIAFAEMKDIKEMGKPNTFATTLAAVGILWLILGVISVLIGG
jgi:hypothetical protein